VTLRRVSESDLESLIAIAERAAARVAHLYAVHCEGGIEIELKGPDDPVTRADREANTLICEALAASFPDAAIVAEESCPSDRGELQRRLQQERVFFVDPLDGTKEFVERRPEFAVMIGLAIAGRAAAGVVHVVTEGRLLAAALGDDHSSHRAFAIEGGRRRDLAVTRAERFSEARMMVSRSHRSALVEPLCRRLGVREMVPCGSVGVKIARLALGEGELYVHAGGGIKLWDSSAPEAILRAAGGRFTTLDGSEVGYRDSETLSGLVASNGVLHAGVLSALPWAEREAARLAGAS
jgi:3'(2'), 5'-bisphosphate nucleotidase